MSDGSNMKNFKIIFPLIDVSLMCSDDTIICSNTLSLSLDDVFSDINHPQVFLHIFYESYQECTLEDIRNEVPAPSIFHTPGRGHHTQHYFTSHYWQRYSEWEFIFCINILYMVIFESFIFCKLRHENDYHDIPLCLSYEIYCDTRNEFHEQ